MTLYEIAEKLVKRALFLGYAIGSPHEILYKQAIEKGKEIPDKLLPGRLIMELPKELRDRVKDLRTKHFAHRI